MKTSSTLASAFCALLVFAPLTVSAADTAAGNIAVSATVARFCTLSAAPMIFGQISRSAHTTASSLITLTCNAAGGTPSTIIVGGGLNSANAVGAVRAMKANTSDYLPYLLVLAPITLTDMAINEVATLVADGAGKVYSVTLYGDIANSGSPAMGSFSDTIGLTVTFTP